MRSKAARRAVFRFAGEVIPVCSLAVCLLTACAKHSAAGEAAAAASRPVAAASRTVAAPATAAPSILNPQSSILPQTEVTWAYADTPIGPMSAVVVIPARAAEERFPVLLTFHGMGEARKGPEKGARGWIDD